MKLPAAPLDQADRRVLGMALAVLVAFLLACVAIGTGLGLGVLAFRLLAGFGG